MKIKKENRKNHQCQVERKSLDRLPMKKELILKLIDEIINITNK